MEEIVSFLEKHWAIFSTLLAGILFLSKHLIQEAQKTTRVELNLKALEVKCQTREMEEEALRKEDGVVVKALVEKIDDYHIKAVAREESIKLAAQHMVDKSQIEIRKEMTILERELRADIANLNSTTTDLVKQMTENNKILIQISEHNKKVDEEIKKSSEYREKQDERTTAFWREHGATLDKLKNS